MLTKIRLDVFLVKNNLVRSRGVAKELIENENVLVNDVICTKQNFLVSLDDKIHLKTNEKYVSRGAYKLKKALEYFNLKIDNLIAVDIGASTGGFTQVLLENNVLKVYAIDVGTDQLHKSIKENKKVISLEKTNFKDFTNDIIKEKINFVCIDVSFISIYSIINKIVDLKWKNIKSIVLLKPQFEIGRKIIKSKGHVKVNEHTKIISDFINFLNSKNIKLNGYIESPIKGAKKENIEYLFYLEF